jgi:hypothetical protein
MEFLDNLTRAIIKSHIFLKIFAPQLKYWDVSTNTLRMLREMS